MKKFLLPFVLSFLTLTTALAADLNPFAYGLKSEYNDKTQTLTINFTLNAPASYVKLVVLDGTTEVWTKEYLASSYQAGKVPKNTYTEVIKVLEEGLPQGKNLTWRVDVKGAAVADPTFVKNDVRLYAPTSLDIDNNPENANFGTVFCVEGLNGAYQTSGYTGYISYEDGAGLYLLNADGSARKMPYQTERVRYGYNGGVVNKDISGNTDRTRPFFGNNGTNDLKGYHAYRVRVSDDGRIFITAFSTNGHVLWEAKKDCFSATTQEEWSANTGWYKIMTTADSNTKMATTKRNCSHDDCGVYSLFQGNAETGTFIAGPNLGFDVRGSGENLKLLMLSGCKQAVVWSTPAHFYCDEYDLGTAHLFNDPTKRTRIFAGYSDTDEGIYIVNPQGVQVQYDKNGNVWMCQHRGGKTETTLARVNRDLEPTQTDVGHNILGGHRDYKESSHSYRRCGAIRFNEDFTQVAIASNAHGAGGGFTVYPVNASTGLPNWNSGTQVDTYSKTGNSLMDFAWDYAGNLYIAADASDNGERIAVYAMPHAADRVVSTPAASRYAFTVSCQAGKQCSVTTRCNLSEAGTIACSVGGNTRAQGIMTVASCTELTVTAVPEDGYKFLNWTDQNGNILSTETEYSLYVTEDIILQANFEYATYTGIVWKNLFLGGPDNDIATETVEYPNANDRLWRLLQVEYGRHYGISITDIADHQKSNVTTRTQTSLGSKKQFNVVGFDNNHTGSLMEFFKNNDLFRWVGNYIIKQSWLLTTLGQGNGWAYHTYMFINRTDTAINWAQSNGKWLGDLSNYAFNGTSPANNDRKWEKFLIYGKPKYWRPYWAEDVCNLPMIMKYSDYMPTISTWTRPSCPTGYVTKQGTSTKIYPSSWYKWNHPHTEGFPEDQKDVDYQKYFILAWRKGSPTAEEIVHHVYESNMELHASYVLKNIDEEDRVDVSKYDASNDDVFKLMLNRRWVNLDPDPTVVPKHDLTVTRKLQAGMFNTICLPFRVDLTTWTGYGTYDHPLKDAEAYKFAGTTTSTYNESGEPVTVLNFEKVTVLEPGVPYLIKLKEGNGDVVSDMPFMDVACYTSLTPSVGGGLIFQPTINPTTVPAGSLILVANNRLAQTTEDGKMNGMRGYFMIDPNNPLLADDIAEQAKDGRVYLSFQKPTTTSIPVAPEAEQAVQPKVRKVMYDGQIYILRGEEVYTITGHRVK